MNEMIIKQLRDSISEDEFRFFKAGEYQIIEIYEIIRNQYPDLCNDNYLCRDHCQTKHKDPEWHHVVRSKLQMFKKRGLVSRGHARSYWIVHKIE
jgi:hypothetical protein